MTTTTPTPGALRAAIRMEATHADKSIDWYEANAPASATARIRARARIIDAGTGTAALVEAVKRIQHTAGSKTPDDPEFILQSIHSAARAALKAAGEGQ